jgi:phosphoesterase RecJ-like protein
MLRVAAAMRAARSVAIGAHVDPDGDAIGSTLGLMFVLRQTGIAAVPVLPTSAPLPRTYSFLPGADSYRRVEDLDVPDVFVSLDCPALRRLADTEPLARAAGTLIMIDHHPDAVAEGDVAIFEPSAAATGCLVWQLAGALGVEPGPEAATCLYTALLTDTGRFSYSNTTAATLRTAADMVDAGAHPNEVYSAVYENRSAGAQALLARTLSRTELANNGRVAYSWVTDADFAETGALPAEAENLIDHVRALGGVEVVVLVKTNGGVARVNLRSKGAADVSAVARQLGGGGHRAAAGVTIDGNLESTLAVLLPLLPGGGQ